MNRFTKLGVSAAVAGLFAGAPADGALVVAGDYDLVTPTVSYGYAYAQAGGASGVGAEVPGGGLAGTDGYQVTANFSTSTGTFSGFGGGAIAIPALSPVTTVAGPSDFNYTLAASLSGFGPNAGPDTGTNYELSFFAPDNTLGSDADTEDDLLVRFTANGTASTAPVFQVLTGGFTGVGAGSLANLNNNLDLVNRAQFNYNFNSGFGDFGNDANNVAVVDNILVTRGPIPEPTTALALVGLAGLGLVRRSRRE